MIIPIKRAILKGFRAVEVDVYPSGDNEIFCSHNLDLERETEGGGFIDELNSETIINIACNTQKKSYIPTLTSVSHKYNQNTRWIIDVKTKSLFHIKHAYKKIFNSDMNTSQAIESIKSDIEQTEEIKMILNFVENSNRGLI